MRYDSGSTSKSVTLQIVDDSGTGVTGLNASTFPPMYYSPDGASDDVAFPALSNLANLTSPWVAGGVKERNGNAGWYRVDLPNGVFANPGVVTIRGDESGKHVILDPLDVVASSAADIAAIKAKTDNLPANPAAVGSAMTLTTGQLTDAQAATIPATGTIANAADVIAIKSKTDNLPTNPAAVGSQMNLVDDININALADIVNAIMSGGSIDGANLQGVLRLIAAAVVGKVAGLPGTTITQRAINDSKTRLTLTLDSNGNITNVVTDAT